MRKVSLLLGCCMVLASCGGGGGSSGSSAPAPAPSPTPSPMPAPTPSVVTVTYPHVFGITDGDGAQPSGPLLQLSDGNFYGTTPAGGTHICGPNAQSCGTVFKMTPSGDVTVLYSFGASSNDAYAPVSPLILGSDGALYGVTGGGGAYGGGTVFRITLAGVYSVLYSFGATATDGALPNGIVQATDGNFYGTTVTGGANHCANIPQAGGNCGTVFKVTPAGVGAVLYSFGTSASDGVEPTAPLILGRDGNLYGTTVNGGANACSTQGETHDCGTVFRITPAGVVTILHSFGTGWTAGSGFLANDGIAPQGPLVQGSDGAFYGTTVAGGQGRGGGGFGAGTVYRITSSGDITILYQFALNNATDGYGPSPFLIQASDGNFYGTTGSGGTVGGDLNGTIFRLTPSGVKTTLYSFGPLNQAPSHPASGVIQAGDGSFYGIVSDNGRLGAVGNRFGQGAVFKMVVQ